MTMKAQRFAAGERIDYTPGSAVSAGDVVVLGTVPMVADMDIAASALGSLAADGVYKVEKDTSTFTAGDAVYWDSNGDSVGGTAGTGAATSTASGNNLMGLATADAATGATHVFVKLTAAKRTATIAGSVTADDITGSDSSLAIAGLAAAQGGAITVTGGTSSTGANAGGAVTMAGGTGGAAGAGGAVSLTGGVPASGNAAGGAGTFSGGAGSGTGAGGAVTTRGGASGSGATGNGGAWSGGGGAALSTNGTGGAASLTGGVSTGTGTGGAVTITSGASAGAGGTAGNVVIDCGAAAGGTAGSVLIGGTNAGSTKIGTGAELAAIKAINVSGTIAVAVPTIADGETDEVTADLSGMTFAPAVGDLVVAIPLEALPTDAILCGAYVSATDTVTVSFSTKEGGSGVTGANKNFKFLLIDLT